MAVVSTSVADDPAIRGVCVQMIPSSIRSVQTVGFEKGFLSGGDPIESPRIQYGILGCTDGPSRTSVGPYKWRGIRFRVETSCIKGILPQIWVHLLTDVRCGQTPVLCRIGFQRL